MSPPAQYSHLRNTFATHHPWSDHQLRVPIPSDNRIKCQTRDQTSCMVLQERTTNLNFIAGKTGPKPDHWVISGPKPDQRRKLLDSSLLMVRKFPWSGNYPVGNFRTGPSMLRSGPEITHTPTFLRRNSVRSIARKRVKIEKNVFSRKQHGYHQAPKFRRFAFDFVKNSSRSGNLRV